jgi:hypothetical protein
MPAPLNPYWHLADADELVTQVKMIRHILRAAVGGDREAAAWIGSRLRGLEQLLGEVEGR